MGKSRKTVVVTGASKGLGLGIVTRLAQEGYDAIIAHYNSGDITAARQVCADAGVQFYRLPGRPFA